MISTGWNILELIIMAFNSHAVGMNSWVQKAVKKRFLGSPISGSATILFGITLNSF